MAESFGRGVMTNHWIDISNSDCILVIGANPAENHPASFHWVQVAKDRGAKLIVVDPRFTRTASRADIYAPMRSGTDIAFIGGMIKYVLDDIASNPGNYNMTYITKYTNAPLLVNASFQGPADLGGLFSGYNAGTRSYDSSTWQYQLDSSNIPQRDETLTNPNCVFQLLKRQFARYDADTVCSITGTPKETYLQVCQTFAATGQTGKAGNILYAMGATHHTYGTQNIRSYAILQLLLGNIGVSGGGIQAMRGESNVQGATDFGLLVNILTGYLSQPQASDTIIGNATTPGSYIYRARAKVATNIFNADPKSVDWLQNYKKYIVSLLKAWYGANATSINDFCFGYLPRTTKAYMEYSWIGLFEAMYQGTIKGLMCWGMNPAVGGANVNMERKALEKLEWLVAVDLWETETAAFWKRPGVTPSQIQTEVFLLPAAASYEKEGSVTNSGRWAQWRYKCVNPPGEALPDLDIMNDLMVEIRELYGADLGAPNRGAILDLTWDYGGYGAEVDPRQVAKEINGYNLTTGQLLTSFANLTDTGTTSNGCWVYCGSYVEPTVEPTAPIPGNRMSRRDPTQPTGFENTCLYPNWAWSWPVNRRIVYNRAAVDLDGNPWDTEHPVIRWDSTTNTWKGDVVDGGGNPWNSPTGKYPFIMVPEGFARLFAMGLITGPKMADGPIPEHYEPWESPVGNVLSVTQNDPAFKIWAGEMDLKGDRIMFPYVATTYRVSEQWQAGQMSRNLPWLVELQPDMFVELSEELAAAKGIANGDRVIVWSARGEVEAVAIVTKRLKPFQLKSRENGTTVDVTVHEVGLPWHWGYVGLSTGDSANLLTPHVGDANTMIPEYKAFLCNIRKKST